MLDGGVLVVPGSDWSVVPSVNPWVGIETMITRQLPGGSAESFGPTQAVTIEEALKIFTENSARQEGLADIIGRIDVGMIADLIVIDKNPYEISPFEIHKINVNKTIIEGEIVYENK
jgi:predicted amidohydrolase YtcJ